MNDLEKRIFCADEERESQHEADRRREPRVQSSRPVYVQPFDQVGEYFEELRSMKDFSRNGFYFTTERDSYHPGMQLHVIPAFSCFNLEYVGEVVRVEPLPSAEYGVAVRLLRTSNLVTNTRSATLSAFKVFAMADQNS